MFSKQNQQYHLKNILETKKFSYLFIVQVNFRLKKLENSTDITIKFTPYSAQHLKFK